MDTKLKERPELPGTYFVSDRSLTGEITEGGFEPISTLFMLPEGWLESLPAKAVLLNIGSGAHRKFESEILSKRPDITTLSIDPTYGINFKENPNRWYIEEDPNGEFLEYNRGIDDPDEDDADLIADSAVLHKKRLSIATKIPGAISGLAPYLPIKNNSVDVLIDCFGPARFLEDAGDYKKYFTSVHDVLKLHGVGYMNFLSEEKLTYVKTIKDLAVEIIKIKTFGSESQAENFYTVKVVKISN